MNFFGIPLYITYNMYTEWLNTYFSFLNSEDPVVFIGYLIVIFIQLRFLIFIVDLALRFLTLVLNRIKKIKYKGWY